MEGIMEGMEEKKGMEETDLWKIHGSSPAVIVGVLIGSHTHITISERRFNLVVGIVLVLIAVRIGWGMVKLLPQ